MTVLIYEDREEKALALGNALLCEAKLLLCTKGQEVWKAVGRENVDVLILGFPLPDSDGLEMLDGISRRFSQMKRVVCTDFYSSFLLDSLQARNVDLVLPGAWQIPVLCSHFRRLTQGEDIPDSERRWQQAYNLLINLGIHGSCRGFPLLRQGVLGCLPAVLSKEDRRSMADALAAAHSPWIPLLFPEGRASVGETVDTLSRVLIQREALFSPEK